MNVFELKTYLERLCYEGKASNKVLFAEDPFETELIPVEAFSSGEESVTLTRANRAHLSVETVEIDGRG